VLARAEQGDADAQNNLGVRYATGEGVTQDKVEAAKWYRKAAEQGNAYAQCNLGDSYRSLAKGGPRTRIILNPPSGIARRRSRAMLKRSAVWVVLFHWHRRDQKRGGSCQVVSHGRGAGRCQASVRVGPLL